MAHLGGFSEEALLLFQHAASEQGYDFSEGGDTYDFTRCVRPDGSFYGTGGTCRKGSPAGAKEKAEPSKKASSGGSTSSETRTRPRGAIESDIRALRQKAKGRGLEAVKANTEIKKLEAELAKPLKGGNKDKMTATPGMAAKAKAAREKLETRENSARVKDLQDRISRGDRAAMDEMRALRAEGKVGKEPGFAPGQKARNEAKETANVKAGKSPTADVKSARKPRATSGELRESQRALFDDAKAKRAAAKEAEKAFKQAEKETKGDKSPEARKRRLAAGRAWDKANAAADRAQTKWQKEHERWSKASEREQRAKMSPAQRAEARRIDRTIRERG